MINDQSQKIFNQSILIVLFSVIGTWILFFPRFFILPETQRVQAFLYAIPLTFKTPFYVFLLFLGLLISSIVAWFYYQYYRTPFAGERYLRVLRGLQLVSSQRLKIMTIEKGHQIRFCDLPVPHDLKYKHFLFTGGTGQGKSVAITDFLMSCVKDKKQNTRLIVIDPNGTYASLFYQPNDVIFNPFDHRSVQWSILNEIKTSFDIETYAMTLIPKSSDASHESFNAMARTVVKEMLKKAIENKNNSPLKQTEFFLNTLLRTHNSELQEFFKDTPALSLLGNKELTGTLRSIITSNLIPHTHGGIGSFSFRDYLKTGKGNIFITWREDQLTALQPLVSCITDVICSSLLSDFENYSDFILCLDELGSLNRLSYLEAVLTKGRKHRLVALAGIQSLSQLNTIYGDKSALTLRGCFSSFAVCAVNAQDTYTPQEYQRAFGSIEVLRKMKSVNKDAIAEQVKEKEYVVKAEEISNLPPLNFYLKFSGDYPPTLVKMKYKAYSKVTENFQLKHKKDEL